MNFTKVEIRTKRLLLRSTKLTDAASLFHGIRCVTRFMSINPPRTILNTTDYIQRMKKSAQNGTDILLTILKEDGEIIGGIGLHNIGSETATIGIWTKQESHGNRYGQEAAQGLIDWVKTNLNLEYLTYPVAKDNFPSRRVAMINGGSLIKTREVCKLNGEKLPGLVYKIPLK